MKRRKRTNTLKKQGYFLEKNIYVVFLLLSNLHPLKFIFSPFFPINTDWNDFFFIDCKKNWDEFSLIYIFS